LSFEFCAGGFPRRFFTYFDLNQGQIKQDGLGYRCAFHSQKPLKEPTMTGLADLYRQIIEGAPEAILSADREGIIRLWNPGAESMFGYTAEEAQGRSLDLIIPERQQARHWQGYHQVMAGGTMHYGPGDLLSVPAVRQDGTRFSCEFSIVPMYDGEGKLSGVGAIMRDVTKRFTEEKALKERLVALEKAAQEV
jgi:PAS domain S-box-containing protein